MVSDIGAAIASGIAAFLATLPGLIGAIVILVVGWIVAGWIGGLLAKGLRMVRFDDLAARAGVQPFLERADIGMDPAAVIGWLVKWYVRLIFVLMAADAVNVTAISTVVNEILTFIPNLIVALLLLGAFAWLANVTRSLVRGAVGPMPSGDAIATLSYAAVLGFGVVAAANQVGIAATLVNTLFIGVVAACALAFGLAFGLGGRDEAASIWRDWRGHASRAIETSTGTRPSVTEAEERRRRDEMTRRG